MILEVKWCGFDYGETIMNAENLRNAVVLGDIYKTLGIGDVQKAPVKTGMK